MLIEMKLDNIDRFEIVDFEGVLFMKEGSYFFEISNKI